MPRQLPNSPLREMASQLVAFIQILKKCKILDDTRSIYAIRDKLNASRLRDGVLTWNYSISKMKLQLDVGSVVFPTDGTSLACNVDFAVNGVVKEGSQRGDFDWQITHTSMNLEFFATGGSTSSQFWHLDTHIDGPTATPPAEAHPMFHLHFGGSRMAERRSSKSGCWGEMLEMRGPRFAHPPMDLILAFDFILANNTGSKWRDCLCKEKEYNRAVCNSQYRFWRPYETAITDFYQCSRAKQENHCARLFLPTLRVASF